MTVELAGGNELFTHPCAISSTQAPHRLHQRLTINEMISAEMMWIQLKLLLENKNHV
jgi:hypothetical protein